MLTLTIRRSITLLTINHIVSQTILATQAHCEMNSPLLQKPLTLIPNPTARARRPIAALLLLSSIPRLHRFRNGRRLVRGVSREGCCDGAVEDVAGDCGVESGRLDF